MIRMEEKIKNAIETALNNCFGDEFRIYDEKVSQGLQKPCFFIRTIKSEIQSMIMNRGILDVVFEIEGYSKSGLYEELTDMLEKIFEAIKIVQNDNEKYFAFRREASCEKDKVIIEAEYRVSIYITEDSSELMEKLEMNE
jgi:hypothetical protein